MSPAKLMKAITYDEYGPPDVLRYRGIEKPSPDDNEVLIKVHAASVTPLDWHLLTGTPYLARLIAGIFKPNHPVLGTDVSGTIEGVGEDITEFSPGDEVFGLSLNNGAFAEYLCAPASQLQLVAKPYNSSFEEAAAAPYSGFTALFCLRDLGGIQPGQQVLINGASGGTGSFAVQIAKSFGAEVTGVCSTRNLERVIALGADRVVDYTAEDFTDQTGVYDLILDVVRKRNFSDCRDALKPGERLENMYWILSR